MVKKEKGKIKKAPVNEGYLTLEDGLLAVSEVDQRYLDSLRPYLSSIDNFEQRVSRTNTSDCPIPNMTRDTSNISNTSNASTASISSIASDMTTYTAHTGTAPQTTTQPKRRIVTANEKAFSGIALTYFDAKLEELEFELKKQQAKIQDEKNNPRSLAAALMYDFCVTAVTLIGLSEGLFFFFGYQETKPALNSVFDYMLGLSFAAKIFYQVAHYVSVVLSVILNFATSGTDVLSVSGATSYRLISRAIRDMIQMVKERDYKRLALHFLAILPFMQSNFTLATTHWSLLKANMFGFDFSTQQDWLAPLLGVNGSMYYTLWQIGDFRESVDALINANLAAVCDDNVTTVVAVNDINRVLVNTVMRTFVSIQISLQQVPIVLSDQVAEANAAFAGPDTAFTSALTRFRMAYPFVYPSTSPEKAFYDALVMSRYVTPDFYYHFGYFLRDVFSLAMCAGFSWQKTLDLHVAFIYQCLSKGLLIFFAAEYVNNALLSEPSFAFLAASGVLSVLVVGYFTFYMMQLFYIKDELDFVKSCLSVLDGTAKQAINTPLKLNPFFEKYFTPDMLVNLRMMQRLVMFSGLLFKFFSPYVNRTEVVLLLTLLIVMEDLREERPFARKGVQRTFEGWSAPSEEHLYGNGVKRLLTSCKEALCCKGSDIDCLETPFFSEEERKDSKLSLT